MEDDVFSFIDLDQFSENRNITILLSHIDGSQTKILTQHTYNKNQIEWFKAGSALNLIAKNG